MTKETNREQVLKKLNKENNRYQLIHLFLLGCGLLLSIVLWNIFPIIIAYFTSRLSIRKFWNEASEEQSKVWARVSGERATIRQLSYLSDEWHLFNDVTMPTKHVCNHILVGPHGVFLVETRNWVGLIQHGKTNEKVTQTKGVNGKRVTIELDNPIQKTKENIVAVHEFLNKHNLSVTIKGCVYIPNLDANIELDDQEIPVLSHPEVFFKYIDKHPYSANLSLEKIQQISETLKRLI